MFDTFDFMAFNWCCILGGPYYPTLPYIYYIHHLNSFVSFSLTFIKIITQWGVVFLLLPAKYTQRPALLIDQTEILMRSIANSGTAVIDAV